MRIQTKLRFTIANLPNLHHHHSIRSICYPWSVFTKEFIQVSKRNQDHISYRLPRIACWKALRWRTSYCIFDHGNWVDCWLLIFGKIKMAGILVTIFGTGINTLAFVRTNYRFSKGGHGNAEVKRKCYDILLKWSKDRTKQLDFINKRLPHYLLTHWLTDSLTHWLTHSLTHSLTYLMHS